MRGTVDMTSAALPEGWMTAYGRLHRDGLAAYPPAALHYVLTLVRHAAREGAPLSPEVVTAHFRRAVRADFGPLYDLVLEDWGLTTPARLGEAVSVLGRAGCLSTDDGDAPELYAADALPFTGNPV
jgi:hypothetical protein